MMICKLVMTKVQLIRMFACLTILIVCSFSFAVRQHIKYLEVDYNNRIVEVQLQGELDGYKTRVEYLDERLNNQMNILSMLLGDELELDNIDMTMFNTVSKYIKRHKHSKLPESMIPYISKSILINSEKHGFTVAQTVALIQSESGFLPWAISKADAIGLSQVHKPSWPLTYSSDYYDIDVNVDVGLGILRQYVDRYGWDKGLSTYNMGPGNTNIEKYNWSYVETVKDNINRFKSFVRSA